MSEPTLQHQTYAIVPGPRRGVIAPEFLQRLAEVVARHKVPLVKLTAAQRLALIGFAPEQAEAIWQDLGLAGPPKKPVGIHYIKACPGKPWCRYGVRESLTLAERLEKELLAMPLPGKTKVGISGCSMNCCEGFVRDLGIFGRREGWTLVFGGNGGGRPRLGDVIGQGLSDDQVLELAARVLACYRDGARPRERSARFMERTGIDGLRAALAQR